MTGDDPFVAYVLDQLGAFTVRPIRMFGGTGLYHDGAMLGFIYEERLYFKAGDANRADFDAVEAPILIYAPTKKGQRVASLREVPAAIIDDGEALAVWASKASVAARRAAPTREPGRSKVGARRES